MATPITAPEIDQLRARFHGEIIQPGDAVYDSARRVYNAMIDKRPGVIARCADVADVVTAVDYGRRHRLLVAVRGGGHNGAWLGVCDNGVVIDLSGLKEIRVDAREGTVRVAA